MNNIAILNFSLRKNGKTSKILNPFMEGLKQCENTNVSLHHIVDWNMQTCQGCYHCCTITPENCKINDDFSKRISDIMNCNTLVFASPIWGGHATHLFKIFIERLYSTLIHFFVLNENGNYGHNRITKHKIETILISTCGLPGVSNFNSLIEHVKSFEHLSGLKLSGVILKPQSLELDMIDKIQIEDFKSKCIELGKLFVTDRQSFEKKSLKISQPILETTKYINYCNERFGFNNS